MTTYNLKIEDDQVMVDPPIPDVDEPVDNLVHVNWERPVPELLPIKTREDVYAALEDAITVYTGFEDGDEFRLGGNLIGRFQGSAVVRVA